MNRDHGLDRSRGLVCIATSDDACSPEQKDIEQIAAALQSSIAAQTVVNGSVACAATEGAACSQRVTAAVAGFPYWRSAELAELASNQGHAQALLKAFESYGIHFVEQIRGAFSFFLSDGENDRWFAGIDRLGQQELCYAQREDGTCILGSSPEAVMAGLQNKPGLNMQGIYNYTYFHMVPSPGTIFEGLKKLPAGHLLEMQGNEITTRRYWTPEFREKPGESMRAMGEELRQVLKRSVSRTIGSEESVAAFLSGGLDSSTVSGMMAEIQGEGSEAYSIGFAAEGYDEMEYARHTASHFGIKLNEYYVTPEDVVSALPEIASSYAEPFGNSSALPAWFCAKLAADKGVNRLLAGDGGDELFAGNMRYARQTVFEAYCKTPAWLRSNVFEPLLSQLPSSIQVAAKAQRYVEQAKVPLPDRLQRYNFLHRHDPGEIFRAEFLEQVSTDVPLELQREVFSAPQNASTLNRMLYLDWQFTLADNDLRKVTHMCASAGVDVTYPMLDDELLEFSLHVPCKWKLKGQSLRHFYKESLRGWLPERTINKSKQGFGLPFGVWMREHQPLQEMAYENLLLLKQHHYFESSFIDKAIALHRDGHAAYYGELVWVLMVLGLWLQDHDENPQHTAA